MASRTSATFLAALLTLVPAAALAQEAVEGAEAAAVLPVEVRHPAGAVEQGPAQLAQARAPTPAPSCNRVKASAPSRNRVRAPAPSRNRVWAPAPSRNRVRTPAPSRNRVRDPRLRSRATHKAQRLRRRLVVPQTTRAAPH